MKNKFIFTLFFTILAFSIKNVLAVKVICLDVIDSDTIVVSHPDTIKVILRGIDCPEKDQFLGDSVFKKVRETCFNRELYLYDIDTINESTLSANISYVDTINTNSRTMFRILSLQDELVKNGLAWLNDNFDGNAFTKIIFYPQAQRNKVGIWTSDNPVHPSIWRRLRKEQKDSLLNQSK